MSLFNNVNRTLRAIALTAGLPALLSAQGPPIQKIATATAISTEPIGVIAAVRELPNGNILVNDIMRRRVMVMDSTMKLVGIALDSAASMSNFYGTQEGVMIPFRGDTTLVIDPASLAMVVLDPQGKLVRVRSIWRVQDIRFLSNLNSANGFPGPDAQGRIVYRVVAQAAPPKVAPPAGTPYIPQEPDSAFVVAVNLDTRKLDTLAVLRTPKTEMRVRRTADRSFTVDRVTNPLPLTDEWAILPNGTVAVVRGREYRIEYLHPDGSKTSSARIPFDWQRLTDEDKQRLVDSTRTAQQRQSTMQHVSSMIRWVNQYNRTYPTNFVIPEGYTLQPGFPKDWLLPPGVTFPENYTYACPPGVEPTAAMRTGPGGMPSCFPAPMTFSSGMVPQPPTPRPVVVAPATDLPDYRPPFPAGSVRADAEGNLWIRTNPMKPAPGGPVFDVVSPQGELTARLQLPPGYSVVGFGKGGVLYLSMRDATGQHVARIRGGWGR